MLKFILPFALAFTAAPAIAQPVPETSVSLHVHYADLDLGSTAGAAELDRRIAHAVDNLCPAPLTRSLSEAMDVKRCRMTAFASVGPQREQVLANAHAGSRGIASGH